jgi:hypothetical protein
MTDRAKMFFEDSQDVNNLVENVRFDCHVDVTEMCVQSLGNIVSMENVRETLKNEEIVKKLISIVSPFSRKTYGTLFNFDSIVRRLQGQVLRLISHVVDDRMQTTTAKLLQSNRFSFSLCPTNEDSTFKGIFIGEHCFDA